MSDGETKIKILKLEKLKDENLAVIAIEQGKIQSWTLLRSDRTSTTYHITRTSAFFDRFGNADLSLISGASLRLL